MRALSGIRVQAAVLIALFLASLATLLFASASAWLIPERETLIRKKLCAAAHRLAESAEKAVAEDQPLSLDLHRQLSALTAEVLADFSGVEGGFFLGDEVARFAGFAFPTDPHPPALDRRQKTRRDPPPKEKHYIETQVQESLTRQRDLPPLVRAIDAGPTGVVVVTEPVGTARPARLVVWVMTRVNGLVSQQEQAHRYQLSVGLALGGIVLALVLTANLGRSLHRERRKHERLREELRQAEHLAALGRMLAGVAHEVRNPLAGIRSSLQLWQRLPDLAHNSASLEAVLRAVDRLEDLVSRLLYFAHGGQDEHRRVDLNAVVKEAMELLHTQAAGQGVTVETELDTEYPEVIGSPQALQQVVLNLAANALQAMPAGGRLVIQLTSRMQPLASGQQIELLFADTGPGVPASARPHLFEPFFTTRAEGAGLGLALCREIIQQHGGSIELLDPEQLPREDTLARGAVFRILLPSAALCQGTQP